MRTVIIYLFSSTESQGPKKAQVEVLHLAQVLSGAQDHKPGRRDLLGFDTSGLF